MTTTLELAMTKARQIARSTEILGVPSEDTVAEAYLVVAKCLRDERSLEYICAAVKKRMIHLIRNEWYRRRRVLYVAADSPAITTCAAASHSADVDRLLQTLREGLGDRERRMLDALVSYYEEHGFVYGATRRVSRQIGLREKTGLRSLNKIREHARAIL